jgi:hypothetical protein
MIVCLFLCNFSVRNSSMKFVRKGIQLCFLLTIILKNLTIILQQTKRAISNNLNLAPEVRRRCLQVQLLQGQPHSLPEEMRLQPGQGLEVHALLRTDGSRTFGASRGVGSVVQVSTFGVISY